ncbi:MAG: arylesterase [Acidobacteriota bacterium]
MQRQAARRPLHPQKYPGPSSSGGGWQQWLNEHRPAAAAGALLLLLLLAWLLWPSPFSKVANLSSRGSNVIAFGDSLTAGYGAGGGEDYPSRLSALIAVSVLNAGVSGDTTEAALARLDTDVLARDPRIVIVGLGGNDFLRGIDIGATEANLRTIVGRIQDKGAMVVLLGFHFPSLTVNYETMYERVARDNGCLLIARPLAGILTDPSLKSDEIHPNARGYALMAERLAGPCGKLVKKANRAR